MAAKLDYHQAVNYSQADPIKVLAQKQGLLTAGNMPFGFKELEGTRGESAYVFQMDHDLYGAIVQEGLGTKSLIAQAVYESTGELNFAAVAQDTVACIINDLVSVGATPVVLNAYWSSSSYDWLANKEMAEDLIKGWKDACDKASVVWGGGETQSLSGVIEKGVLELAGSAFGLIKNDAFLVRGQNLKAGDAIVLVESSGPHANGISLIREIAAGSNEGYQTQLPDGQTLGQATLKPTHLYAQLVKSLQEAGVDIHYLSNITGHGWRKIMRAELEMSYVIDVVPTAPAVFDFIAQESGNDQTEMYANYNMGVGYAVYVPEPQAQKVVDIAAQSGLKAWAAGHVEAGPKQVVIKPLDITYGSTELEVR